MGEIAELMLDGTLCQVCGVLMEDLIQPGKKELKEPPGYPRTCPGCSDDDEEVSHG